MDLGLGPRSAILSSYGDTAEMTNIMHPIQRGHNIRHIPTNTIGIVEYYKIDVARGYVYPTRFVDFDHEVEIDEDQINVGTEYEYFGPSETVWEMCETAAFLVTRRLRVSARSLEEASSAFERKRGVAVETTIGEKLQGSDTATTIKNLTAF